VPVHTPLTQAEFVQDTGLLHWPLELHVSIPLLAHCTDPGVHTPVHAPLTQAELLQLEGVPHWPVAPHTRTALPEHWSAPGVHATHAPTRHTGSPLPHADGPPH
jgi:hypothetical protein